MDSLTKISCTLIPEAGLNLLVPNNAIVEVTKTPVAPQPGNRTSPIIGKLDWQGNTLPIFSANPNIGSEILAKGPAIIVIVKSPVDSQLMGVYASKIPRAVQANQRSLMEDNQPGYINPFAKRYIRIDDNSAIIPDLDFCFSSINQ
jgi:chemotaxis signal transduction protein